ncbi:hypothetical protein FHG87_013783, partial [Trinorchestia longiramus]
EKEREREGERERQKEKERERETEKEAHRNWVVNLGFTDYEIGEQFFKCLQGHTLVIRSMAAAKLA